MNKYYVIIGFLIISTISTAQKMQLTFFGGINEHNLSPRILRVNGIESEIKSDIPFRGLGGISLGYYLKNNLITSISIEYSWNALFLKDISFIDNGTEHIIKSPDLDFAKWSIGAGIAYVKKPFTIKLAGGASYNNHQHVLIIYDKGQILNGDNEINFQEKIINPYIQIEPNIMINLPKNKIITLGVGYKNHFNHNLINNVFELSYSIIEFKLGYSHVWK